MVEREKKKRSCMSKTDPDCQEEIIRETDAAGLIILAAAAGAVGVFLMVAVCCLL